MKVLITITTLIISAGLSIAAEGKKPNEEATKPADAAKTAETGKSAEGEKPKADPEATFKKKDANGDNKLSKDELVGKMKDETKKSKMEKTFTTKDKDKDGFLSKEEFTATGSKKKSS